MRKLSIPLWTPFHLPHFCSCQAFNCSVRATSCQRHNEIICIFAHNFQGTISNFEAPVQLGCGASMSWRDSFPGAMPREQSSAFIPAWGQASWARSLLWLQTQRGVDLGLPDCCGASHGPCSQLPAARVMDTPHEGTRCARELPSAWGQGSLLPGATVSAPAREVVRKAPKTAADKKTPPFSFYSWPVPVLHLAIPPWHRDILVWVLICSVLMIMKGN